MTKIRLQRFSLRSLNVSGEILDHPAYAKTEQSDAVQILESTPEHPSKIELWHSDMTFMAQPPSYTLLQGQVIPAIGGDTLWASATAAFANLSKNMQELLTPLPRCMISLTALLSLLPSLAERNAWHQLLQQTHRWSTRWCGPIQKPELGVFM